MNKPDYISKPDWDILINKYSMKKIEKYLNKNYPYQYLIGNVEFYNSTINVNKNVLIPRWETENLADLVIKRVKKDVTAGLDLCTGSGCLAISLAKELNISFTAIDKSKKALKVAKDNVNNNGVKVNLLRLDILKDEIKGKYDLVVCNPPYVDKNEIVGKETKYEPQEAIFAPNNGLLFYERILSTISNNLSKKYLIAMEIGADQKESIEEIVKKYFPNDNITFEKDLNNRWRYLFIDNYE